MCAADSDLEEGELPPTEEESHQRVEEEKKVDNRAPYSVPAADRYHKRSSSSYASHSSKSYQANGRISVASTSYRKPEQHYVSRGRWEHARSVSPRSTSYRSPSSHRAPIRVRDLLERDQGTENEGGKDRVKYGDKDLYPQRTSLPPPPAMDPEKLKEMEARRVAIKEAAEKEELSRSIKDLTKYVTVQDAMKSLYSVCSDLRAAIKKLDRLAKKSQPTVSRDSAADEQNGAKHSTKNADEGSASERCVAGTTTSSDPASPRPSATDLASATPSGGVTSSAKPSATDPALATPAAADPASATPAATEVASATPSAGDPISATPAATDSAAAAAAAAPSVPPDGLPTGTSNGVIEGDPSASGAAKGSNAAPAPSMSPAILQHARRIMEGLKAVHIVCGASGISSKLRMEDAVKLFRTALDYAPYVLDVSQQGKLSDWVRGTKVLRVLLSDSQRCEEGGGGGSGGKGQKRESESQGTAGGGQDEEAELSHDPKVARQAQLQAYLVRKGLQPSLPCKDTMGEALPPPPPLPANHPPGNMPSGNQKRGYSDASDIHDHDQQSKRTRSNSQSPPRPSSHQYPPYDPTDSHSLPPLPQHQYPPYDPTESAVFSSSELSPQADSLAQQHPPYDPTEASAHTRGRGTLPSSSGRYKKPNGTTQPKTPEPPTDLPANLSAGDPPISSCFPREPMDLEAGLRMQIPQMEEEAVSKLLAKGKLCLILDLDHTLLNSAFFGEISDETEALLTGRMESQARRPDVPPELYRLDKMGLWTKLRPGVRKFLENASAKFELWIHTNGNKAYADAMVELLDPTKELFGSRVIAQGSMNAKESEEAGFAQYSKRLMAGLEGLEPISVILDDSSAVWPHDRRNLMMVDRYIYFPASSRRFGLEGRSLLEVNRDECPERGMLITANSVLDRLHGMVLEYLNNPPKAPSMPLLDPSFPVWDLRNVMSEESRKVLAGVHVVFSRVIPLEVDPRSHTLWRLAEQFGATCSTQTSEATTHVIAASKGTEKTFWAQSRGKFLVTPQWLECSCIMWQRASEDRFAV